jgi:tetratricopeptide (TPR) repeat protein
MARTILAAALLVSTFAVVGCDSPDGGSGMLIPDRGSGSGRVAPGKDMVDAGEMDIVEQVVDNRQAYMDSLRMLVDYYTQSGNHEKLMWARKELGALNTMPQYNYVIEAIVMGPDLRATDAIPEANYFFDQARALERKAGTIPKDNKTLRMALAKYNFVISSHPTSDQIDDAAYRCAGIYEHFKDYSIALVYYQRTYQWNPDTPHPARFKEGLILDKQFRDHAGALDAYKRAMKSIKKPGEHRVWEEYALKRIKELEKRGYVPGGN